MVHLTLTESEKEAKQFVLNVMINGQIPCDSGENDFNLPKWYDDQLYKRGCKYFRDNRYGIMNSNLYGLLSLLADPKGQIILDGTGKSSDKKTAKKRYISTTLHMFHWYNMDLTPGSKSWESLKKVRKMHAFSSNASNKKGTGYITQMEVSLTVFGFMGYALIKPHFLGIFFDNDEDRKAFVHFWAVMANMLGVDDSLNMCLHSLEVVEDICRILQRYIFIPLLQYGTETPVFKKLVTSFFDGMKNYVPLSSFGSRVFLNRRIAGVPGYQYKVDMSKETYIKQIFTHEEHEFLKKGVEMQTGKKYLDGMLLSENIMLIHVNRIDDCQEATENSSTLELSDENSNLHGVYKKTLNEEIQDPNNNVVESKNDPKNEAQLNLEEFAKLLELKHSSELAIQKIEEKDINLNLNDHQFNKLSKADQNLVNININLSNSMYYTIPRYINECMLSLVLFKMAREAK